MKRSIVYGEDELTNKRRQYEREGEGEKVVGQGSDEDRSEGEGEDNEEASNEDSDDNSEEDDNEDDDDDNSEEEDDSEEDSDSDDNDESDNSSTTSSIYEEAFSLNNNQSRQLLLGEMDSIQNSRYETFRRSNLNSGSIKKLITQISNTVQPSNDFAKLLGGIGKVFIGEIVERALNNKESKDNSSSSNITNNTQLTPDDIHKAAVQLDNESHAAQLKKFKHLSGAVIGQSGSAREGSRIFP